MIPLIEFKDFSFHYRAQAEPTLHDISLRIEKGEKILIAGPSGSGKSTLGHCINGLIPHYYKGKIDGELFIEGTDSREMDIFARSKRVGTVLQDADGQFVGLTVGEDVAFALENDCMPHDEMHTRVKEVCKLVDADGYLTASPQELSGGQKQRISMAGVLVDNVDILLFDEPLANLDPATGKYAMELIDGLAKTTGATIIVIEHRLEDVLWKHMDRIVLMSEGRIVADETPDALLASGILGKYGIREPLYLTALGYAGVKITPEMHPDSLARMDTAALSAPLRQWYQQTADLVELPSESSILSLEDVSFSYDGAKEVLSHISFTIHRGEMTAIVGKNGAGKSTLCKLICGFEHPTGGVLRMKGQDLAGVSIRERANSVGLVMQNPNQMISKAMIREEVGLGLKLLNKPQSEIDAKVDDALHICGLYPYRNWPISALSFGQKKRVTIASILVLEPEIMLLDEPTAGQDFHHYTEIMEFLLTLKERGMTILLITHDMHLMLEYARRAIVIADGKMICDDSSARVLSDPKVIGPANLKETSLFTLATQAGLDDPLGFVRRFIACDREERRPCPAQNS